MTRLPTPLSRQRGLSLVELMIALTIGLLLVAGLTLIFVNSSRANRELQLTAQQIENGRYATDLLSQNLHNAGFYGHLYKLPPAPALLPDPCETADTAKLEEALALPVQGYRAPDLATRPDVSTTTCAGLATANLKPGSDILVIRRADTNVAAAAAAGEVYLQSSGTGKKIQIGSLPAEFTTKNGNPSPVRKFHVHVYFVAPCSVGSGAGGICQAGDDAIPTLKRLELAAVGGATTMRIVPLVEGVEFLKVEYGIDNDPATPDVATGLTGDSTVDAYTASPADWSQVIAVKVYVLARNTAPTSDFTDDKTYVLGTTAVAGDTIVDTSVYGAGNRFRRHVYTTVARLMNESGRREIP